MSGRRRAGRPWVGLLGVAVGSLLPVGPVWGADCVGDCNGDAMVAVTELVVLVNISVDAAPVSACSPGDRNGDGGVTVDEIVAGVKNALAGCPAPDPTATPVPPTATPTPGTTDMIPPTDAAALRAWLDAGTYRGWVAESAPHRSTGPHGGTVRTYLNDIVLESLQAGNAAHPAGSALVKELYFGGANVQLWAVSVKVQDDSDGGRGWYWWEGEGLSGVGLRTCTGCHGGGRDYVWTPFPLQ